MGHNLSSVRSGRLRLWEINDEILHIKYFCKEKIELASTFTETDKSDVQFDDLNEYFIKALESRDKGYFEAFIKTYEPVLQNRVEHFVSRYNLTEDDTEDIKQIFLETLWLAFLDYDTSDPIPLLQYTKKAAHHKQLDYIRTTKNACTVPTQNGYNELRKVMGIYNSNPEIPTVERIALIVKETRFTEAKVTELIAIGKATEFPLGIVPTEDDKEELDGAISDEFIEDPSISLFKEAWRNICCEYFREAADNISPKDKQINPCELGFCDGVSLKQTAITVIKEKGRKTVHSVSYAYTPYGDGKAGEILYTAGKHLFQIIRLAEFDVTGAYAEQAAKIIDGMNGNFIKERFYAIPLENLPRINSHNAKPSLPFYHSTHTGEQK